MTLNLTTTQTPKTPTKAETRNPPRWEILARAMRDVKPDMKTEAYSQWLRDLLAIANALRGPMPEVDVQEFVREAGI